MVIKKLCTKWKKPIELKEWELGVGGLVCTNGHEAKCIEARCKYSLGAAVRANVFGQVGNGFLDYTVDAKKWWQFLKRDTDVRQNAAEPLIQALKDRDTDVRQNAAEVLGEIGDARAVEPLIQALKDEDTDVQLNATEALGKIKDARAVEPLIRHLKGGTGIDRETEVEALIEIGEPAVEPLIRALKDGDTDVRQNAAVALGDIRDSQAVGPLINALNDSDTGVRWSATYALSKIGHDAVPQLIKALNNTNFLVQKHATASLGKIGDENAIEPLINLLENAEWDIRGSAVEALGDIGSVRSVEPLAAKLNDNDWHVRKRTADALGKIGDVGAIKPLEMALRGDENEYVRRAAKYALKKVENRREEKEEESLLSILKDGPLPPEELAKKIGKIVNPDDLPKTVGLGKPAPEPLIKPINESSKAIPNNLQNSIGMEFVLIPAGEFDMGSPSDEEGRMDDEWPVHRVKISKSFYMGKYEVTQKQWREVMGNNPSCFMGDNLPVENISWNDVQEFIRKLNEKEGANKYRLPSEAEWEYAARAGTSTRYFFGDNEYKLSDYAWYRENSGGKAQPVGTMKSNPWGLYDMHGNVWEWVQDKWHNSYNGAPTDGSAWEGDDARTSKTVPNAHVFRGGSWEDQARSLRSANRPYGPMGHRYGGLGFRLLRSQ